MHIGILKCGQSPEAIRDEMGDYDDLFRNLLAGRGFRFTTWHVEAMAFPDTPHDAQGWLLTGSRHGVYENHPFIPPLEAFIRNAHAAHVPMVGICFGHQIMAQALGGKVIKSPKGWAVGPQDYDFEGQHVVLNAWHQDQVVELPPGARVIGSNDHCEYAALAYGDRAFSVQAHPEFDSGFINGLIRHRGGLVPPDLVSTAKARLDGTNRSAPLADRIEQFFKASRIAAAPADRETA